jgi:hypothetical protein
MWKLFQASKETVCSRMRGAGIFPQGKRKKARILLREAMRPGP